MSGYSKLFSSIIASTVWGEPDHVRIVWVTMLATCDATGVVEASVPGLAHIARVSVDNCEEAINRFLGPDAYSRTPDNDGRRIEAVPGGWRLLNYLKYRSFRDAEERRAYQREWDRKNRPERFKNPIDSIRKSDVRISSESEASDTIRAYPAQAEAEAEAVQTTKEHTLLELESSKPAFDLHAAFEEFWKTYPKRIGKKSSREQWGKLKVTEVLHAAIIAGIERWRSSDRWKRGYVVDPERFLKRRMWDDEPETDRNAARPAADSEFGHMGKLQRDEVD